jgi:hypothetical protein
MACGTPVVAFDIGGMPDMIEHKINGYLAKPFDTSDLAAGIDWVLSDDKRHKELCIKAREKAVVCFDIKKVAGQYAELYREALGWEIKAESRKLKAERIENRSQKSEVGERTGVRSQRSEGRNGWDD